ncbi:DNA-packaging protein [Lactiplantibacillus pentosus]|uniref:DNA-packaging protein n=1 Tax=Lactiplantibacillus pentosus TaxID=1589 RepID=UPI0021A3F904|nr:DNA-packaging protein [Lactiplantibacillus pentosus]MCT3309275.1 helix-turn-helix domain-containing protein [Lactiplantibacillus pentosus]
MAKYEKWLTPDGLVRIGGWARDGLTDEQIAHNMGISRSTLNAWKKRFSDISDTIGKGKDVVDRQVENALLKRALGTTTTDKMYRMVHKDNDVLDMERRRFSNAWKLKHPEASKKEIDDAAIAGVKEYKRIQQTENVHEFPPDVNAAIFWLRNRKPKAYRDQSFQQLNEAQTDKAKAEARISSHKANELEGVGHVNPLLKALAKGAQQLVPKEEEDDANTTK